MWFKKRIYFLPPRNYHFRFEFDTHFCEISVKSVGKFEARGRKVGPKCRHSGLRSVLPSLSEAPSVSLWNIFFVCAVIKIRTCGYPLPTWCDFAFKSVNMNQNTISIDDDEKHSQYVGATHMDHTLFATRKKSTHTHSHTHE